MRALIERSREPRATYQVALVLSDKAGAAGLVTARELGIATRVVTVDAALDRASHDRRLAAAIDECAPAAVILAGFMRILSAGFVARYGGRLLNIHPSLLPKYPGLHTHRRVLEAGDSRHGATVHFVTEELDGGPRIVQGATTVRDDDDEAALAARVHALEHAIYPLAVGWYCERRLHCHAGYAWLDGEKLAEPLHYDDAETPAPQSGHGR